MTAPDSSEPSPGTSADRSSPASSPASSFEPPSQVSAGPSPLNPPQQARSRKTLARIVAAARELVIEKGAENVTVQEIVDRAGSSVGSFYARFDSRDDLLRYLEDRIWREARERWDDAFRARTWEELPLRTVVEGVVSLLVRLHREGVGAGEALARRGEHAADPVAPPEPAAAPGREEAADHEDGVAWADASGPGELPDRGHLPDRGDPPARSDLPARGDLPHRGAADQDDGSGQTDAADRAAAVDREDVPSAAFTVRSPSLAPGSSPAEQAFHRHVLGGVGELILGRRREVDHPDPGRAVEIGYRWVLAGIRELGGRLGDEALAREMARGWLGYLGATGRQRRAMEEDVDFFDPWG